MQTLVGVREVKKLQKKSDKRMKACVAEAIRGRTIAKLLIFNGVLMGFEKLSFGPPKAIVWALHMIAFGRPYDSSCRPKGYMCEKRV